MDDRQRNLAGLDGKRWRRRKRQDRTYCSVRHEPTNLSPHPSIVRMVVRGLSELLPLYFRAPWRRARW
jgi:hypothetical protein